ncbi:MAG: MiaB/RimO family radical SAM methylthiotransferase [Leptospirales bacterium]
MSSSNDYSFHIITLGCPKNRVDSRTMRTQMLLNGFQEADEPQKADFVIINSCSFIREAQEESIQTTFEALNIKQDKKTFVGLVGCFPERFQEAIENEIPEIDFTMGTGRYHQLPQVIEEKFSIQLKPGKNWQPASSETTSYTFFRIARGCSRKCSFCVIPAIRGPYTPYSIDEISEQFELETKLRSTASFAAPLKEAILVSQDTVSSGAPNIEQVVEYFQKKESIEWIRLHYLFPDPRIFDILDLFPKYNKLVSYLDIPFQHVSPKILRSMNRPDNVEIHKEIIDRALQVRPDMELRTAFILGYPGETETDVEQIRTFIQTSGIQKVSFFTYSAEEGTAGFELDDNIPYEEKVSRVNYLRDEHLKSRKLKRESLIGTLGNLLIDEITTEEIIARRPQDSPEIDEVVFIPKGNMDVAVGDFIKARLLTPMEYDWLGEFVPDKKT